MTAAEWVYAYDPRTGQEIWNVKHPGFSVAPRPVFGHGLVFVCTGYMLPELLAIRPEGSGDITASNIAWKTDKGVPAKPSPLLVGDELYLVSDAGVVMCHDAETGGRCTGDSDWAATSRLRRFLPTAGSIAAAKMAARSCSRPTRTSTRNWPSTKLDGRFMASPAVAGKALFLRTDTHLYRIEQ